MAKTNKQVEEKAEFKWDMQTRVKEFGDDKQRHTVYICTLNGKTYVQDVKEVMTQKNGWKRTKGTTVEMSLFKELQHIIGEWELAEAFGSSGTSTGRTQVNAPNVSNVPKSSLSAKHQAKGSAPAMKGKKLSVKERLQTNANFGSLSAVKQKALIEQVEGDLELFGTVGVILSKTDFRLESGSGRDQMEKKLKEVKGFTRGVFTFITE